MAESFARAFRRAGLEFVTEYDSAQQPAYLDRDMYERIVLNLLGECAEVHAVGHRHLAAGVATQTVSPCP